MTSCKRCGRLISFTTNDNGKMIPINEDLSDHFPTCKEDPKVIEWFKNHPNKSRKFVKHSPTPLPRTKNDPSQAQNEGDTPE